MNGRLNWMVHASSPPSPYLRIEYSCDGAECVGRADDEAVLHLRFLHALYHTPRFIEFRFR